MKEVKLVLQQPAHGFIQTWLRVELCPARRSCVPHRIEFLATKNAILYARRENLATNLKSGCQQLYTLHLRRKRAGKARLGAMSGFIWIGFYMGITYMATQHPSVRPIYALWRLKVAVE